MAADREGPRAFVDAALFMGMHSTDDAVRIACKAFFVGRLHDRVAMSLEQVGRCDDLVWGFPRHVQDAYYPFMDNLHTDMRVDRCGYDLADVRHALDGAPEPAELPGHERLLIAMVGHRQGVLHTVSPRLLAHPGLPVVAPARPAYEPSFPEPLERLYQVSLALRVTAAQL
ncbi:MULTISPECIES: DUF6190 family protein [Streptomycetaceae]|uniref:Uncharacterized protein n=1 Tax=Streptantibioticus cattleyicolor (strain ATCC 35852 / DSM 46488 / JCM 4925 / NBRC 14057 / NRRL 8057) TaxID=1003195 RepID=F8JPS0_STREN|nr:MULTISPECIES: DUF6190 family protein [Streptomycetaceae]AEW92767.1 hypothetical protein SCATT_03960 [Streptantibioticus cattleyicolor NRRL 8057 = DSM 46488]MYS57531.1 hypothetical protein [Streptomyces sp. SID5468]CCB73122.1 conserved protein of unknown function [Streptantibioticus cattleyicolor NRRL 8057 = DSM 46488]